MKICYVDRKYNVKNDVHIFKNYNIFIVNGADSDERVKIKHFF